MLGLEAIGAAAAILQFVDFGSKLLITGYDIYKSQTGAFAQTIHVQQVCEELEAISSHLSQPQTTSTQLSNREHALWHLADKAHDLAWHSSLLLNDLKLKKTSFKSWGALRQSWRLLRRHDKIEEMKAQLVEIKGLLDTNLLILLRGDSSLLIKLVNDQTQQSKHLHDNNIIAIQCLKSEVLATMRQHQSTSLQSQSTLLHTLGDQLAKLAARSTALEKSERILESIYCEEVHRRELGVSEAENRTFSWAFESWCLGHKSSCGCSCLDRYLRPNGNCWSHDKALEPPCADHESCQKHFLNWLERDTNGPFMITGKPGSGKSTFMKFVTGHEQARSALDAWSGGRKLVVASFYFWSSGTSLQRSQDGLLRCLLYKILSQMPDMIPVAVPRRWQAVDQSSIPEPWSGKEISDAFANVLNANSLSTNFCFFIDGLDEYGGSDLDSGESDLGLVLLLKSLCSSPQVKICVSSRPRNVFQGHFPTNGPHHITLHEHTTKDIEQLVESRIERVQGLIKIDDADLEELKHMILVGSSGVFLWVVLVVRELLDGLEPPFSMPEMKARLLMLPATLDGYFQRILDRVHPQYRRFNARLLLLSSCHAMPLLSYAYILWLLEHEEVVPNPRAPNPTKGQYLHLDTKSWSTDTESRIKKVCGDFLIVEKYSSWYIGHNHRSVSDFLGLPAVKEELLALAGWHTESDMYLMWCRIFVWCCEAGLMETETKLEHDQTEFRTSFSDFARDVAHYERSSGTACTDLIYNLDRAIRLRPHLPMVRSNGIWIGLLLNRCHDEWSICEAHALLLCTSFYGFTLFVEQEIEALSTKAQIAILNELLSALVLGCYHHREWTETDLTSERVEFLCSKGANVNSVARATIIPKIEGSDINIESPRLVATPILETDLGLDPEHPANELTDYTIWELYLQERDFAVIHQNLFDEASQPVNLTIALIETGANLECRLPEDCDDIGEAIVKRLKAEMVNRDSNTGEPLEDAEPHLRDELMDRVWFALERRGVTVRGYDTDEFLEDARIDPSGEDWVTDEDPDPDEPMDNAEIDLRDEDVDPIRVALARQEITDRDSDTDEPMEDAQIDLSDEDADPIRETTDRDPDTDEPLQDARIDLVDEDVDHVRGALGVAN